MRKTLAVVTEDVAKAAYCNSRSVYVDSEFGQKLWPSWNYSSHAPAKNLFYRSLTAMVGWERPYKGKFYIDEDEVEYVNQRIKEGITA
jgi:hypothetical protein